MKEYINAKFSSIKSKSKNITTKSINTIKGSLLIKSIKKVNAIKKVPIKLLQLNAPIINKLNKLDPRKLPFLKIKSMQNKNGIKLPEVSAYDLSEKDQASHSSHLVPVISSHVGKFKKSKQQLRFGETLQKGMLLGYVEALGMKNPILSPVTGLLEKNHINHGDVVEYGQLLFEILEEDHL